ncbi:hypothetical protein ACQKGL_27730 [Ensifer adhaerens]|uniref:hypothetical protein n=1 Tax=Ensifer adhaerens TaxID=106592 RepID=UPI003D038FA4
MSAFRYPDRRQPDILDAQPTGAQAGRAQLFAQADRETEQRALQSLLARREAEAEAAREQRARAAEAVENQRIKRHRDEFNAAPWYQKAAVAAQDIMGITTDSATFGAMKYPVAALEAATSDETFDQRLKAYDDNLQAARDRAGSAALAAQLAGGIATGAALEKSGLALASNPVAKNMAGWKGHVARGGRSAIDGAVQGFAEAVFRGEPIGRGTLTGAVSGLGGSVTNDMVFPAANPVPKVNHDPLDFIDLANGLSGSGAGEAVGQTYDSIKDYLAGRPRNTRANPNPVWQNRERY